MASLLKSILIVILSLLIFQTAFSQKKDTVAYYLQNSGKLVSTKDSADFILAIFPPDTSIDKNLFIVKEFYKNGATKLVGNANTNSLDFKFQGSQVTFFPNGHKMRIAQFEKGEPVGDVIGYYPNGKLYNVRSYSKGKKVFLNQFNDSTGNILAENGKGRWREYNENFAAIDAEGEINDGVEEGKWFGRINDSVNFESVFNKGVLISTSRIYKYEQGQNNDTPDSLRIFSVVEKSPEFPGGLDAFATFLSRNIRYPSNAKTKGIQGRVIISFVVERDGSLDSLKILRGIGYGCDEETLRVMKLSPHWKPGMQNGKPVRVAFSVPISFGLGN